MPRLLPAALHAAVLGCLVALAPASRARAADLTISPIVVDLTARDATTLVALENVGKRPARFEVKTFAWAQDSAGQMKLLPSKDLFVFPPLLELAPGETRNLRVGTTAAPGTVERAWRISLEEMPRGDLQSRRGANLSMLTRFSLPVFLAPRQGRDARAEIALGARDGKRIRFTLRNTGTVRLRPSAVKLALLSAAGAALFERELESWYVLAGDERRYDVEVPAEACAKAAEVIVTAKLEAGAVEGRARGACLAP